MFRVSPEHMEAGSGVMEAVGDKVSMVMLILVLSVQPLVGSVTVRLYRDAAVTLRVGEVLPSDHR
jgi:hypothetical protein